MSTALVLQEYNKILKNNPRSAISPKDKEISQRCEYFLNNEPSFSDMKGSVGKACICIYCIYNIFTEQHL